MTKSDVRKTKELANLWSYVERAINWIIIFKDLKEIIPRMIQHIDDTIFIGAGLCNLKPKLIKTKKGYIEATRKFYYKSEN